MRCQNKSTNINRAALFHEQFILGFLYHLAYSVLSWFQSNGLTNMRKEVRAKWSKRVHSEPLFINLIKVRASRRVINNQCTVLLLKSLKNLALFYFDHYLSYLANLQIRS